MLPAEGKNEQEIWCPNRENVSAPFRVEHKLSLQIEDGRIFLNFERPKGQRDMSVVLWNKRGRAPELFYEKNTPDPQGYPKETVLEVLIWCNKCNGQQFLQQRYSEAVTQLSSAGVFFPAGLVFQSVKSTSVVESILPGMPKQEEDLLTDASAEPGFVVWGYGGEILKRCWEEAWWDSLVKDDLSSDAYAELEEKLKVRKITQFRTKERFNHVRGRNDFIKLFTDPSYSRYVQGKLETLREAPLDSPIEKG